MGGLFYPYLRSAQGGDHENKLQNIEVAHTNPLPTPPKMKVLQNCRIKVLTLGKGKTTLCQQYFCEC